MKTKMWLVPIALLALAGPARAQEWTRVTQVPASTMYSVWTNGDTITTTGDSTVYVSVDKGATWKTSATLAGAFEIDRARVRNGRLYAATRHVGVFVSDNLGTTWADFNQGLVGGFGNSQLDIVDVLFRGDSMYVATEGSGAWVRNLSAGTWHTFGNIFGPAQASNMTMIAAGGSRLLSGGGFNGTMFFRDPGDADWTQTLLLNDHLGPGLASLSALWTGTHWVVGTNIGPFVSATGDVPWTFANPGLSGPFLSSTFAPLGHELLLANFNQTIRRSQDDGFTWQPFDVLSSATSAIAIQGATLYSSRIDGLWRRSIEGLVAVPGDGAGARLAFAIAGPNPAGERVRFKFDLPQEGLIAIEVFDVAGRRVGDVVREARPAGSGELGWDASHLAPGVYHARLSAAGRQAFTRFVHVPGR